MFLQKHFSRIVIACLLGSTANSAYTQDDGSVAPNTVVLSSGLEAGGYWNAGNRLQTVAGGMALTVENKTSTGSLSNLKQLLDENSSVSLAFAQADALHYYLADHPAAAPAIETLGDIGRECVFIIADSDGDIETVDDMMDAKRLRIGIKSPNSGIRVTWDYMATLMPALRDITMVYGNAVDMMTQFAHPLTNVERVVMVVHGPNARSPEIDMVIANPDQFRFVEINDSSLTRKTAGGETVYEIMKVKPGAVEHARAVKTICVRGLLLANKDKLTTAQQQTLSELVASQWNEVDNSSK